MNNTKERAGNLFTKWNNHEIQCAKSTMNENEKRKTDVFPAIFSFSKMFNNASLPAGSYLCYYTLRLIIIPTCNSNYIVEGGAENKQNHFHLLLLFYIHLSNKWCHYHFLSRHFSLSLSSTMKHQYMLLNIRTHLLFSCNFRDILMLLSAPRTCMEKYRKKK